MYEFLAPDGKRYPADLLTLQEWARQGRITPDSMLIHTDTGMHMAAGKLIPLQPHFVSGPAPAAPTVTHPAPRPQAPQPAVPAYNPPTAAKKGTSPFKIAAIVASLLFGIPMFVGCLKGIATGGSIDPSAQLAPAPTPKPQTESERKAAAAAYAAAKKQEAAREKEERKQEAIRAKEAAAADAKQKAYEDTIAIRGDDVVLKTGYKIVHEEYSRYISGTVVNESDHALRYAEVKFEIMDTKGNTIESAMDNITYVAPNGSWKFKCNITTDEALRYRPVSVESSRAD